MLTKLVPTICRILFSTHTKKCSFLSYIMVKISNVKIRTFDPVVFAVCVPYFWKTEYDLRTLCGCQIQTIGPRVDFEAASSCLHSNYDKQSILKYHISSLNFAHTNVSSAVVERSSLHFISSSEPGCQ